MTCKKRGSIIAYVPLGVSLPGSVAALRSLGLKIHGINEEIRRIHAAGPLDKVRSAVFVLREKGVPEDRISLEVTLVCRVPKEEASQMISNLTAKGLRRAGSSKVYVSSVCAGRIIALEVKDGLILIKIGRRTQLRRISRMPTSGDFMLREAPSESEIEELLRCLRGGGRD